MSTTIELPSRKRRYIGSTTLSLFVSWVVVLFLLYKQIPQVDKEGGERSCVLERNRGNELSCGEIAGFSRLNRAGVGGLNSYGVMSEAPCIRRAPYSGAGIG